MDALAFLPLGLLIGMAHALEADHLAAVATMMERAGNRRRLIMRGIFWGAGHTIALFSICSLVLLFGLNISSRVEAGLEMAVGIMIFGLGAHLIWKMRRAGVHAHVHEHGDGKVHLHLHQHETLGEAHEASSHDHNHAARSGIAKALSIGLLHGAAGSAGLLVLMLAATQDVWQAYVYAGVFGIGSILGMAALTAVVSLPLVALHRRGRMMQVLTSGAIAAGAIYVGGSLAMESFANLRVL